MKSVEYARSFCVNQPIKAVFPLFSPEGEKHWVPGWNYKNVMGTTELFEDYVFLTESHDHGAATAIWLVKRFDIEAHVVEFYRIEPDQKIGVVKISCRETGPRKTEVEVRYKYLALSEFGERFVSAFTQKEYDNFIADWERLLKEYFASRP